MVSGMLWRNSLIIMDRETETLWSHVTGEAIRGPLAGKRLESVPVVHTTWRQWRAAHPDTLVLVKDKAVKESAYTAYHSDPDRFGITRARVAVTKLPGKALVHATVVDGEGVAAADTAFEEKQSREIKVGERKVTFRRTEDGGVRAFLKGSGKELPVTVSYWFAWIQFYPNSLLLE